MILISDQKTFKQLNTYLFYCLKFINEYEWIADAYVSDFFFKCHWDKLPLQWQKCLQDLSTEDLTILLDKDKTTARNVPPLSFLTFKACTEVYSLDRQCVSEVESIFTQLFTDGSKQCTSKAQERETSIGKDDELHAFFKKHVKPKKRHEIQNLSKVINLLGEQLDCGCVIDVGSGLGHLSRLLSFRYGMQVVSVEAASTHAPKASKFDSHVSQGGDAAVLITSSESSHFLPTRLKKNILDQTREIEKEVKKKKDKGETSIIDHFQSEAGSLPCHVTRLIHPDTTIDEFISVIRENQSFNQIDQCNYLKTTTQPENSSHVNKKMKFTNKSVASNKDASNLEEENVKANKSINGNTEFCSQTEITQQNETSSDSEQHSGLNCDENNFSKSDDQNNDDIKMDKFILTGLHACGDLTATFLRFFVNCTEAKGLASVGCCYMKLSDESNDEQKPIGYPLSESVKSIPNHQLSYAARELACHFADAYCQRLRGIIANNPPHLRIHSYRAALEWLANQICPTFQRSAVQIPAKKTNNLDFEGGSTPMNTAFYRRDDIIAEISPSTYIGTSTSIHARERQLIYLEDSDIFESYVKLGLEKLGMDYNAVTESMMNIATEMTRRWKDVVAFYTIRLSLAPVIETIVLLDRMVFLYEHGYESAILPIFEPSLSPRNFVLLAWKR